jgi:hypothetical protein
MNTATKIPGQNQPTYLLRLLSDGRWHTSREIRDELDSCAPGTVVSACRMLGYGIESESDGQTKLGNTIYHYRLEPDALQRVIQMLTDAAIAPQEVPV